MTVEPPAAPAAPAPEPTPAPAPVPAPAPAAGPFDGITDPELKGWVDNKKFKDPAVMAKSYRDLESLFGADKAGRTVLVPSNWDDPAHTQPFYEKIGVPKTAADYAFKIDGADEKFIGSAKEAMHKLGVPERSAKGLAEWYAGMEKASIEARKAETETRNTQQIEGLKKEWGAAFEANSKIVDAAVPKLGMDEKTLLALRETMGPGAAMKFVHGLAVKLGEDKLVEGDGPGGNGPMTPAQAQAEISRLKSDKDFTAAYQKGEKWATDKMSHLHKMLSS